jgi:hypothetical protein
LKETVVDRSLIRRIAIAAIPAFIIAFAVGFALVIIDISILTPSGAIAWHDGMGNPVSPHEGVPIYAKPHLLGSHMGFVLVSGFLSALGALIFAGWPPERGALKPDR